MPDSRGSVLLPNGAKRTDWLLVVHILSFTSLSLLVFHLNSPVAFFRFDGTFLLSVALNQSHWMAPFGVFSMNPLEGNAGLWFPTAMQLIPGFVVGQLFGIELLPAVAFTWFATEFFVSTLVLGRVIGLSWFTSAIGAWVMALGICPFIVPTPSSERIWGNPHLLTAISANALALAAFISIGRSTKCRDLGLCLVAVLLLTYIGFSQPISFVLALPVFVFFAIVSLFFTKTKFERNRKLLVLGIAAAILIALFGAYLTGLFGYSKAALFWDEMASTPIGWRQESFLLDYGSQFRWLGLVFWLTALVGAFSYAWRGNPQQRAISLGFMAFVLGSLGVCIALSLIDMPWRGPVPAYMDLFAFPFYACFIGVSAHWVLTKWPSLERKAIWVLTILPWAVLLGWQEPYKIHLFRNHVPFPWPPEPTAITAKLKNEIGLSEGQPFRGRVANIAGHNFSPDLAQIPFGSQHNYDAMTAFFVGNDHRMYGLWYFGIPTLIECNQFSSPFFHLLTSRLLAAPGIKHTRPQTTLTRFDQRVFRQLGVRFVLTDAPMQGESVALQFAITQGRNQYLYEIERPNVSGVSPVEIILSKNSGDAIARLADESFDFEKMAVVFEPLPAGSQLVRARSDKLSFFRDHAEISASSVGKSLLILPVEYSRCIRSRLRDESNTGIPRLMRANISQLGILFEGKLTGAFDIRFSPIEQPECRLVDLKDAKRFGLGH